MLRQWEVSALQWFTDLQYPIINAIASVLTFVGGEEFAFLLCSIIFWCFSKQVGFRLVYILGSSWFVNFYLKINLAVSRPVGVEGVNTLFESSANGVSHYPYDSFPSGHAQGSSSVWGYLAYAVQRPVFWVSACLLILAVSISRLYAGLHWPTDVLSGMAIGISVVFIAL
jgi:membrane-associated phospholipid phosphatase